MNEARFQAKTTVRDFIFANLINNQHNLASTVDAKARIDNNQRLDIEIEQNNNEVNSIRIDFNNHEMNDQKYDRQETNHVRASDEDADYQENQSESSNYDKEIEKMIKMYIDEVKYNDENDSFSFKLIMFHDICRRAELSLEIKIDAFFIMLKDLTLDYYYAHFAISSDRAIFDDVCFVMKSYFENAEHKRNVLTK